ncbi:amidohydrolase family protein [Profundibacter sp.]|uniref:amidohydrolase family protein n=1 Tax=Profundibacter sp. TaxID=3101071 RepID=UPI003D1411F1
MFFDTHLHLIYPDRLSYPWLADFPALNKPSTFDDYLRRARRLGITDCLHMEVDVAPTQIGRETELVSELMALPASPMRGAISACRPEEPEFAAFLDTARQNPAIRGFRRVLHTQPDELSQSATFRDNIRRLTGTGLTFDLCVLPRQLGLAGKLADHCPDVRFVLDHCGVPDIAASAFSPWRENMTDLARRPNVTAKISGIIAYADPENWGLDDIRPYFDHTVDSFGHDRIIWGSDSPVCNLGGGLETWVAATHALTEGWSADERSRLYAGNARARWKL